MVQLDLGLGEVNVTERYTQYIGLDFETYSDVDLIKHGAGRYFAGEHFTVLIAATWELDPRGAGYQEEFDFWADGAWDENAVTRLAEAIKGKIVIAHNVSFEESVLRHLGLHDLPAGYVDSAVAARMLGASSALARCAPQLLGMQKVALGEGLIKIFSIPSVYQTDNGSMAFDPAIVVDEQSQWADFMYYCVVDSKLSFKLWLRFLEDDPRALEIMAEAAATRRMNEIGWTVDVDLVQRMKERVAVNSQNILANMRELDFLQGAWAALNVGSPQQLQRFCKERGIRAKSFDEKHVARMVEKIKHRLEDDLMSPEKEQGYREVLKIMEAKKELGGAASAKLPKILNLVSADGQLRDNYLHAGAGQTGRTSGKGVQMQNLPQLREVLPVEDVETWDNEQVARNIRQVFTASHKDGHLVVGDFASVEARALAGLAVEEKILEAYRDGLDLYKVGAADHYGIPYEEVTKDQRKFGKVGVLSCGYGAGSGAVQSFAEGMGIMLTKLEAQLIVDSWRGSHPMTVAFWASLEDAFRRALVFGGMTAEEHSGIRFHRVAAPAWLRDHGYLWSIAMDIPLPVVNLPLPVGSSIQFHQTSYARRWFRGVYIDRFDQVIYHKPVDAKTKHELWTDTFTDKQGKPQKYKLYGGKLAGIATQSLCREMFFAALLRLEKRLSGYSNVRIIGQFHDEIVVDWWPDKEGVSLEQLITIMESVMGPELHGLWPMEAEVNYAYRYLK